MRWYWIGAIFASAALLGGFTTVAGGPATGAIKPHAPALLYVAPATSRATLSPRCQNAPYIDINAAIDTAVAGDTIVVCPGTYTGFMPIATSSSAQPTITTGVEINKSIHLVGLPGATINAAGLDNGVTFDDVSNATLRGFTITGAIGEGVLAMVSTEITIKDNSVDENDGGTATSGYAECRTTSGAQGDCGFGIHLLSVTNSNVIDNTVERDSGGILLTDEYGPTHGNSVNGNLVEEDRTYSGIKLAGCIDTALSSQGQRTAVMGGVYDNAIANNVVTSDGTAGLGAGILLTASVRGGGSYDNVVVRNEISDNGLAGVMIEKHFALSDVSGNVLASNRIGTNNVVGEPADALTTGILVGRDQLSFQPIAATVYDNTIASDHYGIFDNAGTPDLTRFGNHFKKVIVSVGV